MSSRQTPNLQEFFTDPPELDFPAAGEAEQPPSADNLEQMDEETLKNYAKQHGFEVRKARSPRSTISKNKEVDGKSRLTVLLPNHLRRSIQIATIETNLNLSQIAEDALSAWLQSRGYR